MKKIKVTLVVLTLAVVSLFTAGAHAQDPICPSGQRLVILNGECACGATQGPPCGGRAVLGTNWKGAALGL
jgi:hypothetical protein